QKYYKIKPPSYASATLTLYMDLPDVKYNEKERFETEKKLIQIKHNPQKFINPDNESEEIKKLVKEKEALVKKIKTVPLDDKKIVADKIKEINAALGDAVLPIKKELDKKFNDLNEKEEEHKVASFREYPFCFYSPEDLESVVKTMVK
ncbi:MAG: hypothetical protein ABIH00_00395, partial [Armatimonadota bacterium]